VCGHRGNLGNQLHCLQCNAPRGKDVVFYLPENEGEITEHRLINEANAGADWICTYCGSGNKATATHCHSCGNDRNTEDKTLSTQEYDLNNTPSTSEDADKIRREEKQRKNSSQSNFHQEKPKYLQDKLPKKIEYKKLNRWISAATVIATVILSFVALTYVPHYGNKTPWDAILHFTLHDYKPAWQFQQALHTQQETVSYNVKSFYWQRNITIERGEDVMHEDWSVPAAGKYIRSYQAIHHYIQVQDGYETKTRQVRVASGTRRYKCGTKSKGNGYFEDKYCTETTYTTKTESYSVPRYKDKPIYATKYVYTLREWHTDHQEISESYSTKPYRKSYSSSFRGDKWREGEKTQVYQLSILHENQKDSALYVVDFNDWQKFMPLKKLQVQQHIAAFQPTKVALLKVLK